MSVNFLGLNTSFDSAALIDQLVRIEMDNRLNPLITKKAELRTEKTFLGSVATDISSARTTLNIEAFHDGDVPVFPRSVTSTDTAEEYVTVTADGDAVAQQFDLNITQLATATTRTSTSSLSTGVTTATTLDSVALKGAVVLQGGTVTINGETQTYAVTPASDDVDSMLTFIESFTGITSANLTAGGYIEINGVTSLGGAGDTSNLLEALGMNNAEILAGSVTGIQNIDAPLGSAKLNTLGINGTNITVNGEAITFDPATDSINNLISRINTTADTKVNASYDALNGKIVMTNTGTGAISLTLSSTDSNIITQLALGTETFGQNAEFTISTLNGGSTLVSNSNTVENLIQGVTLELKDITASAETITIEEDNEAYKTRVNETLESINDILSDLADDGSSFSRSLASQIRNTLTTFFSAATDNYTSAVEIGLESTLGGDNSFSGFSIDADTFNDALNEDPEAVNRVLYGKTGTSVSALSDGSSGVFVLLNDILETYVDPNVPANGLIEQVKTNIDTQISNADDSIERVQSSIDNYEERLRRQYTQLDVVMAEVSNQQASISGLF